MFSIIASGVALGILAQLRNLNGDGVRTVPIVWSSTLCLQIFF